MNIDKTKLTKHPSGEGWLVPMRNGENAHVLTFFSGNKHVQIIGTTRNGVVTTWYENGYLSKINQTELDLMLDAFRDPYFELKKAHAEGKTIQCKEGLSWVDQTMSLRWSWPVNYYRIKPDWTLGRTVNGHTLPDGREWHRQDWTEDMLPDGWRPLMLGECAEVGDQDAPLNNWKEACGGYYTKGTIRCRTRRPIAAKKPLGPEDVPPGSALKIEGASCWQLILSTGEDCVFIEGDHIDFTDLQKEGWLITRDGGKTWHQCSKE